MALHKLAIQCTKCKKEIELHRGFHLVKKCPNCGNEKFTKTVKKAITERDEALAVVARKTGRLFRKTGVLRDKDEVTFVLGKLSRDFVPDVMKGMKPKKEE